MDIQNYKIAVIGLGYVGLPLLNLFSNKYTCVGIDKNKERIYELLNGYDSHHTNEQDYLRNKSNAVHVTSSWSDINLCNFYIVAVPTPIDKNKRPNTIALENACTSLGEIIKKGDIVVFESTVYPGATEELCVPILKKVSGLRLNIDFSVGYSPERINAGDITHQLVNLTKIVSATNEDALKIITKVYQSVLKEPVIIASQIKVAEAAKMYENVQRDILIATANQYSDFCREEGINIKEVTKCASTKWNFAKVNPGLVGGDCIAVDPYYLLNRAKLKGIKLSVVQAARNVNETKAIQVADRIFEYTKCIKKDTTDINILLLGFSYKANIADIRNTKVADIIKLLKNKSCNVDCYDPIVDTKSVEAEYGIKIISKFDNIESKTYDLTIKMVKHNVFDHFTNNNSLFLTIDYFL